MKSIGVLVNGECLVYVYPSSKDTFKFRSTGMIDRKCKDGSVEKVVYRSNAYSSIQETMPFVCRFIKRQYNIDLNKLPESSVELKMLPFSGRTSPADVPGFMLSKLDALLASGTLLVPSAEDVDEDEEAEDVEEVV